MERSHYYRIRAEKQTEKQTEEQYQAETRDLVIFDILRTLTQPFGEEAVRENETEIRNKIEQTLLLYPFAREPRKRGHPSNPSNADLYWLIWEISEAGYRVAKQRFWKRRKKAVRFIAVICQAAGITVDEGSIDHVIKRLKDNYWDRMEQRKKYDEETERLLREERQWYYDDEEE